MVVKIPLRLITHQQKIANFYKTWLRHVEGNCATREEYRISAVLARAEFDCIFNEKDMRKSKEMLAEKERSLWTTFKFDPIYQPQSPLGVEYDRKLHVEDWELDYWHPLEKAVFPDYFRKRELRKQQFLEMWDKQHQPPPPVDE